MLTLTKSYVAVTVLLFIGYSPAYGQLQPDRCTQRFSEALSSDGDFCHLFDVYLECVIRERSLHLLGSDRAFLRTLQQSVEGVMAALPHNCDVNVFRLVRKVRAEDLADAASQNVSHIYAQGVTEFSEATNIGECANAYVYHVTNTGAVTCVHTTEYTQCVLRTLGADTFTEEQMGDFQEDVNGTLVLLGLTHCVIDTRNIVENLRSSASVSAPLASAITRNKRATGSNPADMKTPLQACMQQLSEAINNPGPDFCLQFETYLKCVIRSQGMHLLGFDRGLLRVLQNTVNSSMDALPVVCDVNISELVREVRVEDLADAAANNVSHNYSQVQTLRNAKTANECRDAFVEEAQAYTDNIAVCSSLVDVAQCLIRVLDLPNAGFFAAKEAEDIIVDQFEKLGLHQCSSVLYLVITDMLYNVPEPTTTTTKPTTTTPPPTTTSTTAASLEKTTASVSQSVDLRTATTVEECKTAYVEFLQNFNGSSCPVLLDFAICLARVLDLKEAGSAAAVRARDIINDVTLNYEQSCDVEYHFIFRNIIRISASSSTTAPSISTTTTSNPSSELETATTPSECTSALVSIVGSGKVTCDDTTRFTTCMVRVLRLADANISAELLESLQRQLQDQWSSLGLQCPLDIQHILEELSAGTGQPITSEPEPVSPEPEPVAFISDEYACVPDSTSGCSGLADGDYQVCSGKCQYGIYATCSNGHRQVRHCSDGWYRSPTGKNRHLAPLVFNPATGTCDYFTRYCPRLLDSYLLQ